MKPTAKAHLALLGANLFYGAGFTVAKLVMPALIQPLGFILIRVLVVTALFWSAYLFGGSGTQTTIESRDWLKLVLGGLFGVALNMMLFFAGLNLTSPIHASLLMLSTPLLITVFAALALREWIGWDKALGLAFGVGGAVLLMSARSTGNGPASSVMGDVLIFLNAASYAIYLVIIKPLMVRYRPMVVIRWVFLLGLLFVIPFSWRQFAAIEWSRFEPAHVAAVAFIVICCTLCTYLWNMYALRILSTSVAGAYIYLQPLFAAAISVAFLGEHISWPKIAAAVLIFSGVYLVNFGIRKKARQAAS